jgi:hypothetical protein
MVADDVTTEQLAEPDEAISEIASGERWLCRAALEMLSSSAAVAPRSLPSSPVFRAEIGERRIASSRLSSAPRY